MDLKQVTTKSGRKMYFNNGKLITRDKYRELSLETIAKPKIAVETRKCIFCGQEGTRSKFVNLQTVYLCDEDYLTKTTGKVAERINA